MDVVKTLDIFHSPCTLEQQDTENPQIKLGQIIMASNKVELLDYLIDDN